MAIRLEIYTFMMAWAAISRLNGLRLYGRKPATVQLYSVCSYTCRVFNRTLVEK